MSKVKIAVQTITFGNKQSENFPAVFEAVAASGATGIELGFRHAADYGASKLLRELADAGLELAALHIGGNLVDTSQAANERNELDNLIEKQTELECPLLIYSGLNVNNDEELKRDLHMLNTAALRCSENGIKLLFHNHNWEFANNSHIMNRLLQDGVPELGLCPDLGWVHVGGGDVITFLTDNKERLGAIHFKDFTAPPPEGETIELGRGCAPLREAAAWMAKNCPHLWAIAEQDRTELEPAEAVAINSRFLREALG